MTRRSQSGLCYSLILCLLYGCSQQPQAANGAHATAATARHDEWIKNGSSACDTLLTSQVVAEILVHPAGKAKALSSQSCTFETNDNSGGITITLTQAGPEAFDAYQQYLADPVPLAGVGDKASRSMIGIDAVKGNDRTCSIDAGGAPGSTRLSGESLAQKLGEVCNKLFALP